MDILIIVWLFILWTIFGSFGSVILIRLWKAFDRMTIKSILVWFSRCPNCKKRLQVKNLIPIVSYFIQWWKCSFCNKKISSIYPTIEIVSGLIFSLTFVAVKYFFMYYIPWSLFVSTLIFWLIVNFLLVLLIIYDLWFMELHQVARRKLLFFSLIIQFFASYTSLWNYQQAFVWSIFFWWIFLLIYYWSIWYLKLKYKKDMEGIGWWDVMLAFLIWTFNPFIFQYNSLDYSMTSTRKLLFIFIILSCLIGLIYYVFELIVKKIILRKSNLEFYPKIAFIPAMIIAFWILLLQSWFFIWLIF